MTTIAADSSHRLVLDPSGRVLNLVLPLERYEAMRRRQVLERADAEHIARLVLEHLEDTFDFMLVTFDPRQPWVGSDTLSGLNFRVRAAATGLGPGFSAQNERFGSDGRLLSVSFLRRPDDLRNGLGLHEIAHSWGQALVATDSPLHWGRTSAYGQLGGWRPGTLVARRGGRFEPRGNRPEWRLMQVEPVSNHRRDYGWLELYMMGLIPADSVPPIEVAIGARAIPGHGAAFTAERIDTLTIADIIAEHGARDPAWSEAQRAFRGVFVMLSFLPVGDEELARASALAQSFAAPARDRSVPAPTFWAATGGRATLQLDDLAAAVRPVPRTEARRRACETSARETLIETQRQILAAVPRRQAFPATERPGGVLEGYQLAHGYGVIRGLGLVLVNFRAPEPLPPILYYLPVDTTDARDWTDFFNPDGPYELVGWGYQHVPDRPDLPPPLGRCIPDEAWVLREAGWTLRSGGLRATPGASRPTERPAGERDLHLWLPRMLVLNLWLDEAAGIPVIAAENPRAPARGIELRPERQ